MIQTQWIGGKCPLPPPTFVDPYDGMTPIQYNRKQLAGLLAFVDKNPGLCFEEIAEKLHVKKKAVAKKMDVLQLKESVRYEYTKRSGKDGVMRNARVWFATGV
jgi:predicted ArsR family transcriptional regulator